MDHFRASFLGLIRDIDLPLPAITGAKGGAFALAEPYLVESKGKSTAVSIETPLPTITTVSYHYLTEPYLIEYYGNGNARTIEEPVPTIPTHDRFALIQPGFMIDGS